MRKGTFLWLSLSLTLLLAVPGCSGGGDGTPPTQPSGTISAQASAYLNHVLAIMEGNSIKRLTINWAGFRASVLAAAGAAQTIPDTYPAIRVALQLLGDGHSFYRAANGTGIFVPNRSCAPSVGSRPVLPPNIGYVRVETFAGSGAEATAFATRLQSEIASADRDDLAGWIVDLRGNGGGNMWPMIAGVGPVLGEGVVGYFIDPVGTTISWAYREGASWAAGAAQERVGTPYRLRRERPRVAVLIDNAIASSGEATFIAFRARPDTRSFGVPTCGLSTANSPFTLSDGAVLNLTVSVMADRTRTRYGDSIPPDEVVTDGSEAVNRAVAWLLPP